ncbi:MAG: DUF1311 domain-containing protein [Clostridiales bacterium]|nr:DUF1311 domain-containing protein [Clostridiales bacterium]
MRKTIIALLLLCLMAVCLTGCQKKADSAADKAGLADYLASVEVQSNALKSSLEKDALTQPEMNQKSGELRDLWDAAMNRMLEEAKKVLPAAEMEKLTAEQSTWLESRTQAAEAAGKEVEGGSMYPLVVNMEAAGLTEARVYELYERLK